MPLRDNEVFCLNHPDVSMFRHDHLNVVHNLRINEERRAEVEEKRGVPVVMFFCPECGYCETYAAKGMGIWPPQEWD